ncbi:MAG: carboxypeptidase regulatory-like domain-containing protein [bacterium]|jgi:hypothetical protein
MARDGKFNFTRYSLLIVLGIVCSVSLIIVVTLFRENARGGGNLNPAEMVQALLPFKFNTRVPIDPDRIIRCSVDPNSEETPYSSVPATLRFLPEIEDATEPVLVTLSFYRAEELIHSCTEQVRHQELLEVHSSLLTDMEQLRLSAEADGFIRYQTEELTREEINPLLIYRRYRLTVQPRTSDGQFLKNCAIEVVSVKPALENSIYAKKVQLENATSAEFTLVSPGKYQVICEHPLYDKKELLYQIQHGAQHLDIIMDNHSNMIYGTVKDQHGSPLSNAAVSITDRETGHKWVLMTNDEGFYLKDHVAFGTYQVLAQKEGYLERVRNSLRGGAQARFEDNLKVVFVNQETPSHHLDFTLFPVLTLKGIVRNEQGVPVPDAEVHTYATLPRKTELLHPVSKPVITDASGVFEVTFDSTLNGNDFLKLQVFAKDCYKEVVELNQHDFDEPVMITVKQLTTRLSGRVVDQNHQPLSLSGKKIVFDNFSKNPNYLKMNFAVTDAQGEFEVYLENDYYQATIDGYTVISPRQIDLTRDFTDVIIVVQKNRNKTIRGTVVEKHQSTPIHNAEIKLYDKDSVIIASAVSDTLGNWSLEGDVENHAAGLPFTVSAMHPFYQENQITLSGIDDQTEYEIPLESNYITLDINLETSGDLINSLYILDRRDHHAALESLKTSSKNVIRKMSRYYSSLRIVAFNELGVASSDVTITEHDEYKSVNLKFQNYSDSREQEIDLTQYIRNTTDVYVEIKVTGLFVHEDEVKHYNYTYLVKRGDTLKIPRNVFFLKIFEIDQSQSVLIYDQSAELAMQ